MYYFLGLVIKEDILSGAFWPSYILCKSPVTSEKRTGLRVVRQVAGEPARNTPKLLVTELHGHDDLLNFLSVYQANDPKLGHYHPEGALCWFSCNQYGDPLGDVYYARKVPLGHLMWNFKAKRQFRMEELEKKKTMAEVLTEEPKYEEVLVSGKNVLYQKPDKQISMKGRKRYGNSKK